MDKEEIAYAVEALMLLGKQEQDIIQTFERRMQTWYPHRKHALVLIEEANSGADFQKTISRIRSEILPVFRQVDYVSKEEDVLKKELEQISLSESILQQEISEAQQAYAQDRFGEEARHKIAAFLQRTEQLKKGQFRERSLNDQVRSAVRNIGPIIRQELALIDEEESKLGRLEKSSDKGERVRIAEEIGNLVSSLQLALFKEKNLVIDPLNAILRIKIDVESKARSLIEERRRAGKITLDDVKKDMRGLTKPDELTEYSLLIQQHPKLSDDKCKIFLSKAGAKSLMKVKESVFERAWESITDGLTGIFNKRYYLKRIHEVVKEAQETGSEISLLVCDLDKFKLVNDTYGHKIGDEALIEVVNIISANKRRHDVLARYGGEEFALIAHEPISERVFTADRIRSTVEQVSKLFVQERGITDRSSLTVSIGVSTFKGTGERVSNSVIDQAAELLFDVADNALFSAKNLGRNRVVAWNLVTISRGRAVVEKTVDERPVGVFLPPEQFKK